MKQSNSTTWVVDVPVATIWTSPDSPRSIDEPGLTNPMDLEEWYSSLTYEKRLALCDDNLTQSQLLFGEEVIMEEQKGTWAKIVAIHQPSKKDSRGYPGWVPLAQLKEVPTSQWEKESIALVTTTKTKLLNTEQKKWMDLSYLTYLPVIEVSDGFIHVKTPSGEGLLKASDVTIYPSLTDIPKGDGGKIVQAGEPFIELPYFWGGMSAFGYDCSGFAYNMHKASGYEIPRDATDQALEGKKVALDQLQIGDLIFFAYEKGKGRTHHVGIYYGDGKMIHSPSTGKGIEIIGLAGTKYEEELCEARRYYV
ncbi:peptidase [Halalkalibacillus sediminis]|uniref:Peptidase n=1 Tax=Halalkalibacillus sediminis TaxID=2018042 RepID=A0A2I0QSZ5_9BACI|nr:C40 family peptidase [Halalkalibacillus sediminis]PKR77462.1 peptidase [Halalkalibacillus sediminis]